MYLAETKEVMKNRGDRGQISVSFRLLHKLHRIMKHGEGGYIVSTCSMSGIFPVKRFPMYDSIKMGYIFLVVNIIR